jgi:small subunit ribosomal protein S16
LSVKIRLRRMGAKKKPFYRVVVADSRTPRDGRFIEQLGYFDPTTEPPTLKIDEEKAKLWLSRGAQPTDTAGALLKKLGILARTKVAEAATPTPEPEPEKKKSTRKKAEPAAEAAPAEPAAKTAPKTAEEPVEAAPAESPAEAPAEQAE